MRVLDRKLLRDLRGMTGQVLTIGLVVAAGIAGYLSLRATWSSLVDSRDAYYERYRFGDAFAWLDRAPEGISTRLEAIPGVARVHTRIVHSVRIPLEGEEQTATGVVVSLPPDGNPPLNAIHLARGRLPEGGQDDEALLLEAFADRRGIEPGDTMRVVMDGSLRRLIVVGIAASPEFVYPQPPGGALLPDEERFAVLWMDRRAVAPVFRLEGAFNDAVFRLNRDASLREVVAEVDRILEPYGGRGAVGRALQPSNYFLEGELAQLRQFATVLPIIFLGVAAFLLNVVLSRMLALQRTQVAALKAVGYSSREIGGHYLKFAVAVVLLGALGGIALGAWMGEGITNLYGQFFGFPDLQFRLRPGDTVLAVALALAAGVAGAMASLRRILRLSPAEAMRPEAPTRYRPSLPERLGLGKLVGPSGRMVLREVGRRPVRLALSSFGIALAVAVLVIARFSSDALEFLIDQQFYRAWREDVTVTFTHPVPERGVREFLHFPGVRRAEGLRTTSARFANGHLEREAALLGYPDGARLRQLIDGEGNVMPLPETGVIFTRKLAELLGVSPGDTLRVALREGRMRNRTVVVGGLVDEMFGLQAHMPLRELNALLDEEPRVTQAVLTVDADRRVELEQRLVEVPAVADVSTRAAIISRFREASGDMLTIMTLVLSAFAAAIAGGVVYNNARVALSMRARDLSSLRVLGFTRKEVSTILFGEMAVEVILAIPIGFLLGHWMAVGIAGSVDPERYRLPVMISPWTYGYAVAVILLAAALTAVAVRRRVNRLDLVGVLKTQD